MKWPKDQVEIYRNAVQQFIDNCEFSLQELREIATDLPELLLMYKIGRTVDYDLQFDDSHPAFAELGRQRKVDHNPAFVLYPKGCDDTHRKTMLRHVGKLVGLID